MLMQLVEQDGIDQASRRRDGNGDFLQENRSPKAAGLKGSCHFQFRSWQGFGLNIIKKTVQIQVSGQVVDLDWGPWFCVVVSADFRDRVSQKSKRHHRNLFERLCGKLATHTLSGLLHGIVGDAANTALVGIRRSGAVFVADDCGRAAVSLSEALGCLFLCRFVANIMPWRGIAQLGVREDQEAAWWCHLAPDLDDLSDDLSLFDAGSRMIAVTVLFDEGTELNVA